MIRVMRRWFFGVKHSFRLGSGSFSQSRDNTTIARLASERVMGWKLARGLVVFLLLVLAPAFAADGMFQGTVVDPPTTEPSPPGWIFVKGGNRLLRRVEVSHARVTFGNQVPASQRRSCHSECIEVGQVVRILADQDSQGEWRAKQVIILEVATNRT
jgi:hypothetical protein